MLLQINILRILIIQFCKVIHNCSMICFYNINIDKEKIKREFLGGIIMNKKVIVSSILAISLVAFSGIAYAEEQNNDTPEWFKSMIQWRKEQVNEQVKSGDITEEQGKQWNEKIDAMEEFHKDNGFTPDACGNSISEDGTTKGFGQGMMGNFNNSSEQ